MKYFQMLNFKVSMSDSYSTRKTNFKSSNPLWKISKIYSTKILKLTVKVLLYTIKNDIMVYEITNRQIPHFKIWLK